MENQIDEAFLSFPELIENLSDVDGVFEEVMDDEKIKMEIESIKMELPIQLDVVVDENGKVLLGSVPPLYDIQTSFDPVFHQIGLTLEKNEP